MVADRVRVGIQSLFRFAGGLVLIAAVTWIYARVLRVNSTTVALTYLLVVLGVATGWGLWEAAVASGFAMVCFNYFFLPPVGASTIEAPQNWVALFAFLATSVTASRLSSAAKRRTQEAVRRQHELERLYALSRAWLLSGSPSELAKQIAHQTAQIFELRGAAFFNRADQRIYRAGPEDIPADEARLRDAAVQGTVLHDSATSTTIIPIRLGGVTLGSLAVCGSGMSETTLHSVANLAAITLERVRAQEAASHAEAVRESEELKSTLLDAMAHEFKTPLTPIKAAVTALLSDPRFPPAHRDLLQIVNEEADRLSSMLTEAIQMARLEAGKIRLQTGACGLAGLAQSSLQKLETADEGRRVEVDIPENLPLVEADPELVSIALWQLLSNSLRYTPPGSLVAIQARALSGWVTVRVADCGPGIPAAEQERIFEKFYRGKSQRGLIPGSGMGLAIAREIVRAHGGKIWVENHPGPGAVFAFTLPVAHEDET